MNKLNQSCFQFFRNPFSEQKSPKFLTKDEKFHPNFFPLLQVNTDIICRPEVLPKIFTQAIPANRPTDHDLVEIRSNQSMVKVKTTVKQSKQNFTTVSQIETTSVISNPKITKSENTEKIPSTDVSEISPPTSFTLTPSNIRPLNTLIKTFRSLNPKVINLMQLTRKLPH